MKKHNAPPRKTTSDDPELQKLYDLREMVFKTGTTSEQKSAMAAVRNYISRSDSKIRYAKHKSFNDIF